MSINTLQQHRTSAVDYMMVAAIENNHMKLAEFDHATHLKLAYCYLAQTGPTGASIKMPTTLKKFLKFHGVAANKFHATLTEGWLKAIWHFMQHSAPIQSSDDFLQQHPVLMNKDILLSHYSHERLFSDQARKRYVEPDLNPFPHG